MSRTLLILALASVLGAQTYGGASYKIADGTRVNHLRGPGDDPLRQNPGWWQRHLGDTALHAAATSVDAATSWGRVELNPLLRSADGRFGARGLGIKLGILGGVELAKWSLLRRGHRGRWVRSLSLAPTAALGAAAARNAALRPAATCAGQGCTYTNRGQR